MVCIQRWNSNTIWQITSVRRCDGTPDRFFRTYYIRKEERKEEGLRVYPGFIHYHLSSLTRCDRTNLRGELRLVPWMKLPVMSCILYSVAEHRERKIKEATPHSIQQRNHYFSYIYMYIGSLSPLCTKRQILPGLAKKVTFFHLWKQVRNAQQVK